MEPIRMTRAAYAAAKAKESEPLRMTRAEYQDAKLKEMEADYKANGPQKQVVTPESIAAGEAIEPNEALEYGIDGDIIAGLLGGKAVDALFGTGKIIGKVYKSRTNKKVLDGKLNQRRIKSENSKFIDEKYPLQDMPVKPVPESALGRLGLDVSKKNTDDMAAYNRRVDKVDSANDISMANRKSAKSEANYDQSIQNQAADRGLTSSKPVSLEAADGILKKLSPSASAVVSKYWHKLLAPMSSESAMIVERNMVQELVKTGMYRPLAKKTVKEARALGSLKSVGETIVKSATKSPNKPGAAVGVLVGSGESGPEKPRKVATPAVDALFGKQ